MATITIKNIPDDLYAKLKKVAAANHRSINGEVIMRLRKDLAPHVTDDPEAFLARIKARRKKIGMIGMTNAQITKAKRAGRP